MPDKLTDKEIVKAFQMCTLKAEHPGFVLCGQIVDLINRLQAEVERLKRFKNYFDDLYGQSLQVANWHLNGNLEPLDNFIDSAIAEMGNTDSDVYKQIKAEAYKEFAERLISKAKKTTITYVTDTSIQEHETGWIEISLKDFNNLLKELVGE